MSGYTTPLSLFEDETPTLFDIADETAVPELEPLTIADRCDVCEAQAFVRVILSSGQLLFCGHHYRANAAALEKTAVRVQDETEQLSD